MSDFSARVRVHQGDYTCLVDIYRLGGAYEEVERKTGGVLHTARFDASLLGAARNGDALADYAKGVLLSIVRQADGWPAFYATRDLPVTVHHYPQD